MRAKLSVGAEGELVLPPGEADGLGLAGGGEVDVVSARGAFALVTPARGDAPQAWFAGTLAALTVPEVIQFVFTSLKSGVLLLDFGEEERRGAPESPDRLRRKSLYFRDGQVVFASSSDPADRLGGVLLGARMVTDAELDRCARLVRSGRPLGQVLVDEGVLTSGQLYEALTLQVREILLGAFVETAGTFAFLEGPHDEGNAVKLPERTRELLLEGMKRVEEAERLAHELGGKEAPLSMAIENPHPVAPLEARLLEQVDAARPAAAVARAAGVALLPALRALAALAKEGVITAAPPAPPPEEEEIVIEVEEPAAGRTRAAGPFETYRRILKHVYGALRAGQPDAASRLNSYFDRLPAKQRPIFEGVRVAADGEVDVAQVLVNVSSTGAYRGAAAKARSLEALEDLLSFALFEVKNCLPREDADRLLREVGRMQVGKR